ncbi:MAG: hypothetical protein AB1758_30155, partial [Candidatus Eremiobacterota bacterium]
MLVTSTPTLPARGDEISEGRRIADEIKKRSTLVGLVEPLGVTVGLLSNPVENFHSLQTIATSLWHGDTSGAGAEIGRLVDRSMHPEGVGGVIYKSGLSLRAAVDGLVGGLEVYQGVKRRDPFLGMMGAADLVSGSASAAV